MQRIVRTEALCLRSRPIRESSKLVTFFALDEGRLVCVARGARRPKSKFGAALEPFAVSRIIYYRHAHGPYRKHDDLLNVEGIGPGTVDKLRSCTTMR